MLEAILHSCPLAAYDGGFLQRRATLLSSQLRHRHGAQPNGSAQGFIECRLGQAGHVHGDSALAVGVVGDGPQRGQRFQGLGEVDVS